MPANKVTPPKQTDIIIMDNSRATLRLFRFFTDLVKQVKQYLAGTDSGFDITGTAGFVLVRGVLLVEEVLDDIWRVRGNIDYTHDSTATPDLTIANLVFKTGPKQVVLGHDGAGTETTKAWVATGSSVITVVHSGVTTSTQIYIDVELNAEPSFYI